MMQGKENTEDRKQFLAWLSRKTGSPNVSAATIGQEQMRYYWQVWMHSLPHAAPIVFQNEDGSFPYLPGMDGPVNDPHGA